MPETSASLGRGERRLLAGLAALDRLMAGKRGEAYLRLERELGPERARFLVGALARNSRRRREPLRPAASA